MRLRSRKLVLRVSSRIADRLDPGPDRAERAGAERLMEPKDISGLMNELRSRFK